MELEIGLRRLKTLVSKVRGADILTTNPDVLERLIEIFHIIEDIEVPHLVDSIEMMQFTTDGEEPKA
tara:strand:- start:1011 stop:1211 length:201 start_codon:yes stop_codon:yes gene_type:complete